MERVSQPLRRERVAGAFDCQTQMNQMQQDMAASVRATRNTIIQSQDLLARTDELLARWP
jgi:hypothetical protein